MAFLPCLLSAGLLELSFPKIEWSFLAWVALVPLLCVLDGQKPWAAFRRAYLCGFLFFAATLGWFVYVTYAGAISVGGFFVFIFCSFWDGLCLFSATALNPTYFRFGVGLGGPGICPRPSFYRFWLGDAGPFAIPRSLAYSNSRQDRRLWGVVFGDPGQSFDF